jgi:MFS transporter, OFA family, oxalate/formate antiporter
MVSLTGEVRARPYRWLQLILGILCMAMIANLQYGWTLFVSPIDSK